MFDRAVAELLEEEGPDALVVVTDRRGVLLGVSPAFEVLVGMDLSDSVGTPPPRPWWIPETIEALMVISELMGKGDLDAFAELQAPNMIRAHDDVLVSVTTSFRFVDDMIVFRHVEKLSANVELIDQLSDLARDARALLGHSDQPGPVKPERRFGLASLSRRENEVLMLLLQGHRSNDIAETLYISRHTVRNHIRSIFKKLDVHSQLELITRFGHDPSA